MTYFIYNDMFLLEHPTESSVQLFWYIQCLGLDIYNGHGSWGPLQNSPVTFNNTKHYSFHDVSVEMSIVFKSPGNNLTIKQLLKETSNIEEKEPFAFDIQIFP